MAPNLLNDKTQVSASAPEALGMLLAIVILPPDGKKVSIAESIALFPVTLEAAIFLKY
jgi:hypothetical protein